MTAAAARLGARKTPAALFWRGAKGYLISKFVANALRQRRQHAHGSPMPEGLVGTCVGGLPTESHALRRAYPPYCDKLEFFHKHLLPVGILWASSAGGILCRGHPLRIGIRRGEHMQQSTCKYIRTRSAALTSPGLARRHVSHMTRVAQGELRNLASRPSLRAAQCHTCTEIATCHLWDRPEGIYVARLPEAGAS
jgi:hypothetical protein